MGIFDERHPVNDSSILQKQMSTEIERQGNGTDRNNEVTGSDVLIVNAFQFLLIAYE